MTVQMGLRIEARHFLNLGRATVAAGLLAAAPGAFESPKFFGKNTKLSHTTEAAELNSPLEQNPALVADALKRYSELLSKKDANAFARFTRGSSAMYWKEPRPFDYKNEAQFLSLLRQAFSKGAPELVGYKQGPKIAMSILFKNLSLGHPDVSGYSYLIVSPLPFGDTVSYLPNGVEEVTKADLEKELKAITRVGESTKPESPLPTPTPVPKPGLPDSLKKPKVAYIGVKDGNTDIYVANSDGTGEKRLTNNTKDKRELKWLNDTELVFASLGDKKNEGEKAGIVKINTETGEEEYLTSPKIFDSCPSADAGGNVIFSRLDKDEGTGFMADSYVNVYTVNQRTKEIEQLTRDTVASGEECPTPSPDGKMIAFGQRIWARHVPGGTVIFKREDLKNFDPSRLPPVSTGMSPLFWSPDSKFLYLGRYESREGGPGAMSLHRLDVETGKVEDLKIDYATGASLTERGDWIISTHSLKDYVSVMAHPLDRTQPARQLFERNYQIFDIAVQPKPAIDRNTIILFPGLGSVIKDGNYQSGIFDEAITEWIRYRGYKPDDILLASLGGWGFNSEGIYYPKNQECDSLLKGQDYNSEYVLQLLRDLQEKKPNSRFTLVTHSLGSIRVIRALQRIQEEGITDIDVSRLSLVTTHGPNIGLDKPGLDWIAGFWPPEMGADCDMKLYFFNLPWPSSVNYPALAELKKMWDEKDKRRAGLKKLADWIVNKGGNVTALENYKDGVMSAGTFYLPPMAFWVLVRSGEELVADTQEFPGAVTIKRFYSGLNNLGHRSFWNPEEGLDVLLTVVGDQMK